MTLQEIERITREAHDAAVSVLAEPTSVVPLVRDARYCHKWVPFEEPQLDEDGNLRHIDDVRAAAMHLAQEMTGEGVREYMPLELPKGDAMSYRVDSNRLSVRVVWMYVLVPVRGKPGFKLRVDMAGLKP